MRSNTNRVRAMVFILFLMVVALTVPAAGQTSSNIPVGARQSPPVDRLVVTGVHGAVAAAGSVAPSVGMKVLMDGGNAVDAAIATATTLTVTTPYMCGIGGHGTMVIYWAETGDVMALDFGTGVPKAFDLSRWGTPPTYPAETDVANTVLPATLAGWAEALDKLGTITLAEALEPAIQQAEDGVPVNAEFVDFMSWYDDLILNAFPEAAKVFMPEGRPPKEGEVVFPDLAATYRLIAEKGPDVFYKGELGDKVLAYLNEEGSMFTKEEFENYKPIWRDVLSTTYRDEYEIFTIKNQNFSPIMLTMFNIWEHFDIGKMGPASADELHLILETGKSVLPHKAAYYGDPDFWDVPYDILISKEFADKSAKRIDMNVAVPEKLVEFEGLVPPPGMAVNINANNRGCTTNIAVADKDHNIVLLTQTLGGVFGSLHVVPGTGITLNNEGIFGFLLDPVNGPNYPAPGKRIENQMAGAIILKNGKPWAGIGAAGADKIPLDIAATLMRMIEHDVGLQEAIEMPRATYFYGMSEVDLDALSWPIIHELYNRGHELSYPGIYAALSGVYINDSGLIEAGGWHTGAHRVAY